MGGEMMFRRNTFLPGAFQRIVASTQRSFATTTADQSRKERIAYLRKVSFDMWLDFKDSHMESYKRKNKKPKEPPDWAWRYLHYVNYPVPDSVKEMQSQIEDYIINIWLPKYPIGARLRNLQRDMAWGVQDDDDDEGGSKRERLPYKKILPIIGKLQLENKIVVRLGRAGRIVLEAPLESNQNDSKVFRE